MIRKTAGPFLSSRFIDEYEIKPQFILIFRPFDVAFDDILTHTTQRLAPFYSTILPRIKWHSNSFRMVILFSRVHSMPSLTQHWSYPTVETSGWLIRSKQLRPNAIVSNPIVAFSILTAQQVCKVNVRRRRHSWCLLDVLFLTVMLQPHTTGQQDDRSKHKFMVQWVAVPDNYSDDVENFVRGEQHAGEKLTVLFSGNKI